MEGALREYGPRANSSYCRRGERDHHRLRLKPRHDAARKERMSLAALLLVLTAQAASGVVFEVDLWPGEGRPVLAAGRSRLELRESPSESAKVVATWTGRVGRRLTFDDTRYRTATPGRVVAIGSATITGRDLGEVSRLSLSDYYSGSYAAVRVAVKAGDAVEYLQYRAEGTCFVRVAGRAIDADPCPTQQPNSFRLEVTPTTEWWIHIVDGKTRGWLLITDRSARVIRREG